jgi:hypothetical protein
MDAERDSAIVQFTKGDVREIGESPRAAGASRFEHKPLFVLRKLNDKEIFERIDQGRRRRPDH